MPITGRTAAEIFDSIRTLQHAGQLAEGQALPTVRALAARLGVNRNTVSTAYRRLAAAGIAATHGRRGTVIRQPPSIGEQEGFAAGAPPHDLGSGNPNPDWLPDLAALLAARPPRKRLYGEAPVDPQLEALARERLLGDCPRRFELDLTHGSVDALERLLCGLVPGDKVAVEDPCFVSSINTLRVAGFQAVGVAVDDQGMRADELQRALAHGARAVIVTPRAHNPTGASLTAARARQLRAVLARHPQVRVIVDDHFSQLAVSPYHHVVPPATQRWALVRSVSKIYGPDLRLAFVASDAQTAQQLRLRLARGTNWVSHLLQDAVAACLSSAKVARQVARARDGYAERREMLAAALRDRGIDVVLPADGLNLWLPMGEESPAVAAALARKGWIVRSGEAFGVRQPAWGLRVTVSGMDGGRLRRFVGALCEGKREQVFNTQPHPWPPRSIGEGK
jgi:DNA-binding transcriptional MocR family regulator